MRKEKGKDVHKVIQIEGIAPATALRLGHTRSLNRIRESQSVITVRARQEEVEKATGLDDEQTAGLLERPGGRCFCLGLKGTDVPLGRLLRAVLIQTARQL